MSSPFRGLVLLLLSVSACGGNDAESTSEGPTWCEEGGFVGSEHQPDCDWSYGTPWVKEACGHVRFQYWTIDTYVAYVVDPMNDQVVFFRSGGMVEKPCEFGTLPCDELRPLEYPESWNEVGSELLLDSLYCPAELGGAGPS